MSLVHESVTEEEIAKIISRWTGIPVSKTFVKLKDRKHFILKINFTRELSVRMKVLQR